MPVVSVVSSARSMVYFRLASLVCSSISVLAGLVACDLGVLLIVDVIYALLLSCFGLGVLGPCGGDSSPLFSGDGSSLNS